MQKGNIGVTTDNIFPVIKKFLYSDHEIFLRELVSNAIDAEKFAIPILDYRSYVSIHVFASLVRNCHFTPKSIDDDME